MDSSATDLSSSLVQEVAATLTGGRVPEMYICSDGCSPAEEAIAEELLIDFSRLSSEYELEKLRYALSKWKCFQVVNHGIETEFLEKVLEVSRRFFALPLEEKKKSYGAAGMFNGYGNDGELWGNQTRNWNDRLYLRVKSNDPADLRFWPENPPDLSKTVDELADKIQAMPEIILKAMARSLGLDEDCFLKHNVLLDSTCIVKLNLYPQCPNPDKVFGFTPHSDGTLFTMLLQDREGLQVMANDRWFKAPIIPGALVVIVGDLIEIMSNGRIESTIHRVVTSLEKERVSVAMFYNPSTFEEIGPVDELVTDDRPVLYKKTSIMEYAQVHHEFIPKGKRPLLAFKL
ncbi:hypothetical protein V2J09_010749 [Rumex salicifolius]